MPYGWAWPEELSIHAKVTWSQLYTYDILDDGQAPEDDTAYLSMPNQVMACSMRTTCRSTRGYRSGQSRTLPVDTTVI